MVLYCIHVSVDIITDSTRYSATGSNETIVGSSRLYRLLEPFATLQPIDTMFLVPTPNPNPIRTHGGW